MAPRSGRPAVIAHRGASGYLPEHTLEAKALAYGLGADYLEQDLVATKDDRLLVLHDIHLDRVTDVAARFPDRARADGRWYARDFTLAEIRKLQVTERLDAPGGRAVYAGRFPAGSGSFRVHTLAEEIDLLRGLNTSTGRRVGLYPEIKRPAWHREEGVDLAALLLAALADARIDAVAEPVFIQCFDAAELRRLRQEFATGFPLVQLMGENDWGESDTDYESLQTPAGLASLAATADAIGPWVGQLYRVDDDDGRPRPARLAADARAAGLAVHPYTFRADELAPGFDDFEQMVRWFVSELEIDALFTDFPDRARAVLNELGLVRQVPPGPAASGH
ncbi:MAG: glycerophosphodiester phosphodiesterase [Gammaproteobacteria bacterium]|jgi:glycerophosphoryl diester phosphodiesterase|nr:glycerophosphodiester phosphodiesterase [Gammaproteobacteria bacterium]